MTVPQIPLPPVLFECIDHVAVTTEHRKYPIIDRPAEMRIDNAYILDKDRF